VAIALLDLAGDTAAGALGNHFSCFRERYLAGKTIHKGSITATESESV
jgi:DTW domain-containing protein YfiP